MYECVFAYVYIYMQHVNPMSEEARREHSFPGTGVMWLYATMWVLEAELGSSARATRALTTEPSFQSHSLCFQICCVPFEPELI